MKELLEEYVMEALQMRQELDLLRRVISYLVDDETMIELEQLKLLEVLPISVEEGVVSIG